MIKKENKLFIIGGRCAEKVCSKSVWESRQSRDKFQYGMLRCLFRIRASGVRSHLCSTGVMMRKKKRLEKS